MGSDHLYKQILLTALDWAEKNNYSGYSKFDALNSPILRKLCGNSTLARSVFVYLNSRSPINVRPFIFVEKRQNPKGLALFARSYFNLYNLTNNKYIFKRVLI